MTAIIDNPSGWRRDATESTHIDTADDGWQWGIVEILGRRMRAGKISETSRYGCALKIEVPIDGNPANGWRATYYGAAAIFSVRITTEAEVMQYYPEATGDDADLPF